MTNYGIQYSTSRPAEVEMTDKYVFVAKNITPYSQTIEEHTIEGFSYEYIQYTKDEYLMQQNNKVLELEQELQAAKILLGVD